MDMIENFEKMLREGKDSALLRYGLGGEYLKQGDQAKAVDHFRQAVALDPHYTAAWKLLGKSLAGLNDREGARAAWQTGLEIATTKGDKQAMREIEVFLKRLDKPATDAPL